jgi:hypothetical protein
VSVIRVLPTPRGAGHLFRAVVAAWFLVLALVVPAGAVEGPTRLFDPSASDTSATPTTTITFTVTYRNREGSAPAYVRVVIDGHAHDMTGDGGDDWKGGVGHHFATKLAVGTHDIAFVAADTRKFTDAVDGGTVTIAVPTPTPDPTPAPTPTPKPDPTPAPTPTPPASGGDTGGSGGSGGSDPGVVGNIGGGDPGSTDGNGTGGDGTGGSGPGGFATGGSTSGGFGDSTVETQTWGRGTGDPREYGDKSSGSTNGSGGGTIGDGSDAAAGGPAVIGGTGGPSGPGGMSGGPGGSSASGSGGSTGGPGGGAAGGGSGWGQLASALGALGIQTGPTPMPLLPTLVSTTGAVAMAMAFAIFGKKRRDEEQPAPDEVLEANAARASAIAASSHLAPVPAPVDIESLMPRWRRPSLQQARKNDPTRSVAVAPRLRFDDTNGAGIGYERRLIRYRVVSLLDAPDELRSVEIGQLDQGDEVQLLEKSGAYWRVLCPDGRQGWLHKMTLGDVVAADEASSADAWNVGDIDGDVLSAYLAARARA